MKRQKTYLCILLLTLLALIPGEVMAAKDNNDVLSETGSVKIKQISASNNHTMILLSDGTLWACGNNNKGQLCDGTTTKCNKPKKVMIDVDYVAAGSNYTMIVKKDGSLWACGENHFGQFGDGTTTDCSTPKQVMTGVKSVTVGFCNTMIVKTDGSLWACGYNEYGQVGDGTKTNRSYPKKIMTDVDAVSAGWRHTLILKTDGSLWGCGDGFNGRLASLGLSTNDATIKTPKQIMTGVAAASAACDYTMILKTDGSLWACGMRCDGLGTGTTSLSNYEPKQVTFDVATVSTTYGAQHTMIVKKDGSLWACGSNKYGQLGDGTTNSYSTPKKIMTDVSDVTTGGGTGGGNDGYTMIVKTDGSLWACGFNYSGQLGDGTNEEKHTPVRIEFDIKVASITLNKTSLSLKVGQEETLTATIIPDNAKDKSVTWSSSNNNVATVDSDGKVTAKDGGTATITCSANDDSGVKATCTVTVTVPVTSLTLNETAITLNVGTEKQLTATVLPDNATDKTVTWSSSDEGTATVSSEGKVTAIAAGTATINCTANDGSGVKATCSVTVIVPVSKITLNKTAVTLKLGEHEQISATVLPENATDKTVTWKSSDAGIASVSSEGVVTAKGGGTATITCSANDKSGVQATCTVTVTVPVSSITINKKEITMFVDDQEQLTATVLPNNATDKSVTWKSSTPAVATVSSDGKVTGIAAGSATITCSANDGSGIYDTCVVTVEIPVPLSITLPSPIAVPEGQTITITPTITPPNAVTTLTWASDDEAIATVDANGVVTGVKKGMTFIIVTTDNGLEADCKLTVTAPEVIKIEIPSKLSVGVGQRIKIEYTITPENAETTVSWTIDDESVATIDDEGFITGKAEGLVKVIATTANGLTSNSCRVTVTPAANVKGDVNGDSSVDVADIASIITVMATGTNDVKADVNGDGTVDVADISSVISIMAEQARLQRAMTEEE